MANLLQVEAEDVLQANALVNVAAAAGRYNGSTVGLFTNNITPNKSNVIGDLIEPVYAGYAQITPTWGTAVRDPDGLIHLHSSLVRFAEGGAITVTRCYGMFIAQGGALQALLLFDTPLDLVDSLSQIEFVVDLAFGRNSIGTVELIS